MKFVSDVKKLFQILWLLYTS